MNPIFKWAGGKRQLLPELRKYVPAKFNAYYEPFAGGAALFFDLLPERAHLSDLNGELIQTYMVIRTNVESVITALRAYEYRHKRALALSPNHALDLYYSIRAEVPNHPVTVAARMIYLNKTCFNGLYRVNKAGLFNTPYGHYKNPIICDEGALYSASTALRRTTLRQCSFRVAFDNAKPGDFVYCDPPYPPTSSTANFTAYTAASFNFEAHEMLAHRARLAKQQGVQVVVSNADLPVIRELYKDGFTIHAVQARRNINSKGDKRQPVGELIIT